MKLSPRAIPLFPSKSDTAHSPQLGQTVKIDLTSKLFILLAAYTLVHASVYFWYQSRKQAGLDSQKFRDNADAVNPPRRRVGSGIHNSKSHHQMFLLAAMLLAALILAGLAIFTGAP